MAKKDSFAKFIINSTDSIKELLFVYTIVILLCSYAFTVFESMAYRDAIWMAFVTSTSTGYGDFFPKTNGGRMVAVFLMHSVLFVVAPLMITRIIGATTVNLHEFTHEEQEENKRKQDWIIAQLEGQTGQKYVPENA